MLDDRIRAALREIVTASPVPAEKNALRQRPQVRRWLAAALAGLAVTAIVAVISLVPVWSRALPTAESDQGPPTLPDRFPAYSFVQGTMDGPFGRAIAMYRNGTGHEDFSFSQMIVAGADR